MSRIPAGSRISRIPGLSRIVMVLAASLVALCAAVGVPDASAPSFTTVAQVSDTSPGSPPAASKKCKWRSGKKGCGSKHKYKYSDADLRNLSNGDLETVATLTTVLAVIALAAVI